MTTNASKLKAIQEKARVDAMPVATIKMGRKTLPASSSVTVAVLKGKRIKEQMDALKAKLEEVNAVILKEVPQWMDGVGTLHILIDDVDCTVTLRDAVTISDVDSLQDTLGDRFKDLVKAKVSYSPEPALIEMAVDADEPLQGDIAACLRVQEAKATVSYKAA